MAMDTSELMEKIEKGFTNLRTELGEQMVDLRTELGEQIVDLRTELGEQMEKRFKKQSEEFTELQTNVAAKIEEGNHETKVTFEALRHDLKIFDEDSTPGSTITLARRVTSLEGRVKNLEKAR